MVEEEGGVFGMTEQYRGSRALKLGLTKVHMY